MRNLRLLFLVGLATGIITEKYFVSSQSPVSTADDLYLEGRPSGDFPIDDEDGEDDGSGSGSGDYAFTDLMDQEEKLKRFLNLSRTTVPEEMVPSQPKPTANSQTPTTAGDSQHPSTTVEYTEKTSMPEWESKDKEVAGGDPIFDWFTSPTTTTRMTPGQSSTTKPSLDVSKTKDAGEDNSLDQWDVTTTKNSRDEVWLVENENEILLKEGRDSRFYGANSPKEVTSENLWERTEVLAAVIACGVVGFLCAVFLLLLLAYRMKKKDEGSYDLGDTKLSTTQYHKAPTKEFYA